MKTRTDTGMSRIRLASLALLAGLLLTIAWPLNISAQVSSSYGNWQRNGRVKDFGKPGAGDFGGKNGGGLLNNENNEYNLPSYWLSWNECFTVLVREANLLFLDPGTTPAEGPASGRDTVVRRQSDDEPIPSAATSIEMVQLSLVSVEPITVIIDGQEEWDVQLVDPILNPDGSLVSNLPPIDIGIWIGQIEVALQNPKLKEDKRKKLEDLLKKLKAKKDKPTGPAPTGASQVEVNSNRVYATNSGTNEDVIIVCNRDGTKGSGTRFNPNTVGNNQEGNLRPWQPVKINSWPFTLNPDGSLVSNLPPIDIGIRIGQIEVALQKPKLKEDERKKLEDILKMWNEEEKNKNNEPINLFTGDFDGDGMDDVGTDEFINHLLDGNGVDDVGTDKLYIDESNNDLRPVDFDGDGMDDVGTDESINPRGGGFYNVGTDGYPGATVALNKNGNAVISSDQGTVYFKPDGSSVVVTEKGNVKLRTKNGDEITYWFSDPNNNKVFEVVVNVLDGKKDEGKFRRFSFGADPYGADDTFFSDGFESGNTSAWSDTYTGTVD